MLISWGQKTSGKQTKLGKIERRKNEKKNYCLGGTTIIHIFLVAWIWGMCTFLYLSKKPKILLPWMRHWMAPKVMILVSESAYVCNYNVINCIKVEKKRKKSLQRKQIHMHKMLNSCNFHSQTNCSIFTSDQSSYKHPSQ